MKKLTFLLKLLIIFLIGVLPLKAQNVLSNFEDFNTDGVVWAIEADEANDLVYVGGLFNRIGQMNRYGAAVNSSGDVLANYAEINGTVNASIADGSGGFYIGGEFTEVDGQARNYLAQIDASGNVTSWNPSPNSSVNALAIDGSTVYVGGGFSTIGGQSRVTLAGIDTGTGLATSWNPGPNSTVYSLAISGSNIFVGGQFTSIGGQSRERIAVVDLTTGNATSWNPGAANSIVRTISISGGEVYIGGSFTTIGGTSRNYIASINESTGVLNNWNPSANSTVYGILVSGGEIYVGGAFATIGGQSRSRIASFTESTGAITSWNPTSDSNVNSFFIEGTTLYCTGLFSTIEGVSRSGIVAFDTSTGDVLTSFDTGCNGPANTVASDGTQIFVGGAFFGIGGEKRSNLAAINYSTGQVTSWAPDADGNVHGIVVNGADVIVGGSFANIGGASRNRLAIVDATTGLASSWNPNPSSTIRAMALDNGTLYIGGFFTNIDGTARNYVGAVNASTGTATSWNPNSDNIVYELAVSNSNTIYVGGNFTSIGGQSRNRIAELSLVDGMANSWDPNANNIVYSIDIGSDETVYAAGSFTNIGGQSRNRIAAIDQSLGTALSWNPSANNIITDINIVGDLVYAVGSFSNIVGTSRSRVAAIHTDGTLDSWTVSTTNSVQVIEDADLNVFIGGNHFTVGSLNFEGLVAVDRANGPPLSLSLDNNSINENQSSGAVIGSLSSDDDAGDTHTYALVSGAGDDDNASFTITGAQLEASEVFDFEIKSSYSVRIRSTDNKGFALEKSFTVSINNVIETETDILTFSIPGQVGSSTIDDVNHTIQFDMGLGADVSDLTPAIIVSSGASISPLSGVSQDFSSSVNYTVTAENGSTQGWDVTVTTKLQGGTYTIGSAADYNSVITALTDVRDNGISGNVIFEIEDGYTDTWNSSLTFDDFEGTDTYSVTVTVSDGASSATINAPTASLFASDIKNFIIDGKNVLEFQSSGSGQTALLQFNVNFTSLVAPENIEIKNTKFSTQRVPIIFSTATNVTISGCEFSFLDNSATYKGFFASVRLITVDGANVFNNKIQYSGAFDHLSATTNGDGKIHGIDVQTGGSDMRIYNNSIHLNPINARSILGISVGGISTSLTIDHNTILIEGANSVDGSSQGIIAGINDLADVLRVSNNIISITRNNLNGTEKGIAHSFPTDLTISHNNIFITDDAGTEEYVNGLELGDLATILVNAPGTTVAQPAFTNPSINDLTLSGASLSDSDFRGIPIPEITGDLLGTSRNTLSPSRGAFESPNNITDIFDMTFTELTGNVSIDDVNHAVLAEATLGTNLTTLAPTFSLFVGASISPNSGTTRDFTNSVSYTVTAEDATSQLWSVTIVEENSPPTDIQLTNTDVDEKSAIGTVVGDFSSTDSDPTDSHTYSLVSGEGDTDNASFNIFGNLRTSAVFDFETKSSYSIRVQSNDGNGGLFSKEMIITINDINDDPTDVDLSITNVNENLAAGSTVGTLTSVDQDAGDSHTYSLKVGNTDNDSFTISGDQLLTAEVFDYETKSTYNLEIITDDGNGGSFEQEIAVSINDEASTITGITLSSNSLDENSLSGITIGTFSTQGTDLGGPYIYSFATGTGDAGNGAFNISGNDLVSSSGLNHEVVPTIDI
ncbi:MAG: cadherin domain-containing protein [Bacteroidetes bacterium]|nr:cadherin domain-containing protein [Bacteroidota bacterium]